VQGSRYKLPPGFVRVCKHCFALDGENSAALAAGAVPDVSAAGVNSSSANPTNSGPAPGHSRQVTSIISPTGTNLPESRRRSWQPQQSTGSPLVNRTGSMLDTSASRDPSASTAALSRSSYMDARSRPQTSPVGEDSEPTPDPQNKYRRVRGQSMVGLLAADSASRSSNAPPGSSPPRVAPIPSQSPNAAVSGGGSGFEDVSEGEDDELEGGVGQESSGEEGYDDDDHDVSANPATHSHADSHTNGPTSPSSTVHGLHQNHSARGDTATSPFMRIISPEALELAEQQTEIQLMALHRDRIQKVNQLHLTYIVAQLVRAYDISEEWIDIILKYAERCTSTISVEPNKRTRMIMTAAAAAAASGLLPPPIPSMTDDHMDITTYVKIKSIPGGHMNECKYVEGVMFRKNVAHKKMKSSIQKPKILLLNCALEYQRVENRLSSLDTVLEQEKEYITIQVSKILTWKPDVIVVEKSVSRFAQDLIREAGVTLVLNVKPALMARLARATRAMPIVPASDYIDKCASIGTCGRFMVESFTTPPVTAALSAASRAAAAEDGSPPIVSASSSPKITPNALLLSHPSSLVLPSTAAVATNPSASTDSGSNSVPSTQVHSRPTSVSALTSAAPAKVIVISFDECAARFHATILLRGASSITLKRVKYILRMCIHVAYHLSLEAALLFDECGTYAESLFDKLQSTYHSKISSLWGPNSDVTALFASKHTSRKKTGEGAEDTLSSPSSGLITRQNSVNSNGMMSPPPLPSSPPPIRAGFSIPLSSSPFIDMTIVPIPSSIIDARRSLGVGSIPSPDGSVNSIPPTPLPPPLWIHDAILFGSTWFSSEFQCFPPECKGIQFYTQTDKTLGCFLLENCFDLKLRCLNEKCGKDVLKHTLAYTHAQGRIVITVKKIRKKQHAQQSLFSPIPAPHRSITHASDQRVSGSIGAGSLTEGGRSMPTTPMESDPAARVDSNTNHASSNNSTVAKRHPLDHPTDIMMWSRCKQCSRRVTPYMAMSDQTYKLSFGKFLDLTFHQEAVTCRTGSCTHSIHGNHVRFFGFAGLMASFEYESFPTYEMLTVPRSLAVREPWLLNKYAADLRQLALTSYAIFEEFIVRIAEIDGLLNLQEHRDQLRRLTRKVCMERDRFTTYLQQMGHAPQRIVKPSVVGRISIAETDSASVTAEAALADAPVGSLPILSPVVQPISNTHAVNVSSGTSLLPFDSMDIYRLQRRLILNYLSWNHRLNDLSTLFFPKTVITHSQSARESLSSWWNTAGGGGGTAAAGEKKPLRPLLEEPPSPQLSDSRRGSNSASASTTEPLAQSSSDPNIPSTVASTVATTAPVNSSLAAAIANAETNTFNSEEQTPGLPHTQVHPTSITITSPSELHQSQQTAATTVPTRGSITGVAPSPSSALVPPASSPQSGKAPSQKSEFCKSCFIFTEYVMQLRAVAHCTIALSLLCVCLSSFPRSV
jgi:hypothetical protein